MDVEGEIKITSAELDLDAKEFTDKIQRIVQEAPILVRRVQSTAVSATTNRSRKYNNYGLLQFGQKQSKAIIRKGNPRPALTTKVFTRRDEKLGWVSTSLSKRGKTLPMAKYLWDLHTPTWVSQQSYTSKMANLWGWSQRYTKNSPIFARDGEHYKFWKKGSVKPKMFTIEDLKHEAMASIPRAERAAQDLYEKESKELVK